MDVAELAAKLAILERSGYVASKRRGNTGVGYTLESLLDVGENNLQLPDLGEIELKSHRKGASSLITLFTFNRGAWRMPQADMIREYGYVDPSGRQALYSTVNAEINSHGLSTRIEDECLKLYHMSGKLIAEWTDDGLARTFSEKMPALVIVYADSRIAAENREEFWFNEAFLFRRPNAGNILELIGNSRIVVDIRMHINAAGGVRNHGTAFRINESFLGLCFGAKEKLL